MMEQPIKPVLATMFVLIVVLKNILKKNTDNKNILAQPRDSRSYYVRSCIICDDEDPWDAEGPPAARDQLVNFVNMICGYIYSTEEYQNMSLVEGGYV